MKSSIERVVQAIDDVRAGKMVILVDDEDRENEGDLVIAAEKVTPEAINFMATHGRGLICLALAEKQIERLKLPMMVRNNEAALETAFTVSIEARRGVTTGISARDRATTILAAIAEDAQAEDLVSPGHIFPLRARPGGVLVRTGQTEGSVDLARLAGLAPAGVICEIMREDGEMARMPELEEFARKHGVTLVSVADMIAYRLQHERIVKPAKTGLMRPRFLGPGEPFRAFYYGTQVEATEYLALVRGDVQARTDAGQSVLVRVHAMCPVGDPFGIRPEIDACLRAIDGEGAGVFLYVYNKARTSLSRSFDKQVQAVERATPASPPSLADREAEGARRSGQSEVLRDFGLGAQVLADLGCRKVRLMSNSDRRIAGIEGFGIEVVERVPIPPPGEPVLRPESADERHLRAVPGSSPGGTEAGARERTHKA